MSIGEILEKLGIKVPAWLGFGLMLAASLTLIVGGAIVKEFTIIPLGAAGIVGTLIAWIAGAKASPNVDRGTMGGVANNIPTGWWFAILGVMLVGIGVAIAIPHAPAATASTSTHERSGEKAAAHKPHNDGK
jgi:hypothetical protein